MRDLANTEFIFGHTSEETALEIPDYPYGRRIRTTIRYWIETVARKGDRFCSQTLNPKTGRWNKPKRSTYSSVAILIREADTGYIRWTGLGTWPDMKYLVKFLKVVGDKLNDEQKNQVAEIIGRTKAFEHVTFSIHEGPMSDEEKEQQEHIQRRIGALSQMGAAKARREL